MPQISVIQVTEPRGTLSLSAEYDAQLRVTDAILVATGGPWTVGLQSGVDEIEFTIEGTVNEIRNVRGLNLRLEIGTEGELIAPFSGQVR